MFIDIDPTKIDVNVHPNKTEIKFDDDQNLYSIINSAVKHCLGIYQVSPVLDFDKDPSMDVSYSQIKTNPKIPSIEIDSDFNPFQIFNDDKVENLFSEKSQNIIESDIELEDKKFVKIFQIFNKYIVSASTSSLIIINQKLAHQRILYESFLKSMFDSTEDIQKLAFPYEYSLSKEQLILFKKIDSEFKSLGFEYELYDTQLKILSIPNQLKMNSIEDIIDNILNDEYDFDESNSLSNSDFLQENFQKVHQLNQEKIKFK